MISKRAIVISLGLCFFAVKSAAAEDKYIVNHGDTLWSISIKFNFNLEYLISINPQVHNPHLIFPGDAINVPGGDLKDGKFSGTRENALLERTNAERLQSGFKKLVIDNNLSKAAKLKCLDMMQKEYVSHNSPTYGNPTIMLRDRQIPFRIVKENIGAGYNSADEIFSAWMNSSLHRENLLDEKATHIGIGYAEGGLHGHYWTILIVERD